MTLELTIDFKVTHKRTDIDIADTICLQRTFAHWAKFRSKMGKLDACNNVIIHQILLCYCKE